jgi:predicted AlkP superfamily phosphohydrolase/phosphomutase/tetratricopeptide (TPR) repeat protein
MLPVSASEEPRKRRRILLIGWDAADWQHIDPLLERGLMPSLAGLLARGVRGNLASLMPMVSPMLWTSVVTGRTADEHGVHGFVEADPDGAGVRPWSVLSRRGKAIWNILHQEGWRCSVVGWWASHPAEPLRGTVVSNLFLNAKPGREAGTWKMPVGAVHPVERARAMARLRVQPEEITGDDLIGFVPRLAEVDQDGDRRLDSLARVLSATASVQAAATEIMETEPWEFMGVYFEGIDLFCHGFMPYHPPRMAHIAERDYGIYSGVVASAYRFHDMMLGRLLELTDEETVVVLCSDHGFLSGANRPLGDPNDPAGPTVWHREMGMLVMAGPGIVRGGEVHGASLLDVTPTLLTLCGLPCGRDMPGRPLLSALEGMGPRDVLPRIASWDEVAGGDGSHPAGTAFGASGEDAAEVTRQLVALGYVEDNEGDAEKAALSAKLEADYNLAQVHLSRDRAERAVPLLESCLLARPWESRYIHQLAHALNRADRPRQTVELLMAAYPESDAVKPMPVIRLLLARALLALGEKEEAWRQASLAAHGLPMIAGVCVELAEICLDLGKLDAAGQAVRRALALEDGCAAAWQVLAALHLRKREDEDALEAGLASVERLWQAGRSHFLIGMALVRLGRTGEARIAFERAAAMLPRHPGPWRMLAALPGGEAGGEAAGGEFVREACRMKARMLSRAAAMAGVQRRNGNPPVLRVPILPPPSARRAKVDGVRPPSDRFHAREASGRTLTLVSGLPRSGTSLMMQMLAAGGMAVQTDGERGADEDNPEGYWEWEAVKQIGTNPAVLDGEGLEGKAIKCVSAHLLRLPGHFRYRVIFMHRPAGEIARSQQKMIERRGTRGMDGSLAEIASALERHRDETLAYVRSHPRAFDLLEIDYPALVADPEAVCAALTEFLGPELLPESGRMAAVVRPDLYRNRSVP